MVNKQGNHPRRSRMKTAAVASTGLSSAPVIDLTHDHNADWATLLAAVQKNFDNTIANNPHLFRTDVENLFSVYLDNLPGEKQVHNCRTCKRFINAFGGLVVLSDQGGLTPALWNQNLVSVPEFYKIAIASMHRAVSRANVTGALYHAHDVLGIDDDPDWTHLHARIPRKMVFMESVKTPFQAMAAKREDFSTLATALSEFTTPTLLEAKRVLDADAVNRAEKFTGPLNWLLELKQARDKSHSTRARDAILWRAVAAAPAGFCHPRSGVIGSLLEDIAAGKSFDTVRRNFNKKTAPLAYQRPQVPPSAGTIRTAERIFEKLDLARSLERRFATLDDVDVIWRPKSSYPRHPTGTGVFGHLSSKQDAAQPTSRLNLPPQTMTWEKFVRTVLPNAQKIEQMVPAVGSFIALTAPVHADAKPLFKWDNPIAWYVYPQGSYAHQWNLVPGWTTITAVVNLPSTRCVPELGTGAVLVLDKAVDMRNSSLALYPECLRSELHEVRSVIEAHSRSKRLAGAEYASACGYDVRKKTGLINVRLRVFDGAGWMDYTIDRWD